MSFPAPGDTSIDTSLDLNQLVKNPVATFFMRVEGEGLTHECIHPGDLLIVDRSLDPVPGKLVVAAIDGSFVIRRLERVEASERTEGFEIWGVITTIIHSV